MKNVFGAILAVAVVAVYYFGLPKEASRVGGVALLRNADEADAVMYELLSHPLTEAEVGLFLENVDPVLDWAEANAEKWMAADSAENPLQAVRELALWKQVDLKADEFSALLAKLIFTQDIQGEGNSVGAMKKELAEMKVSMEDEATPVEHRELIRQGYEQFAQLIEVVEKSGPQNLALYIKNQERIDAALRRFDAVGE